MSSDSVEMRMRASSGTSATTRSSNEKKPSCHDSSSNTTLSIASRSCRSSSRCVITPARTSRSPSPSPGMRLETHAASARSASLTLPAWRRIRSIDVGMAPHAGVDHAPAVEQHDAFVVAQIGRHAQRARLPAQVEQLEDVVDAELAERSLDRHLDARGGGRGEDRVEVHRRARFAARAARELAGRIEVDHLAPALDRVAESLLIGEQDAVVVQRADVIRVEAQDARIAVRASRLRPIASSVSPSASSASKW